MLNAQDRAKADLSAPAEMEMPWTPPRDVRQLVTQLMLNLQSAEDALPVESEARGRLRHAVELVDEICRRLHSA